MRRNVCHVPRNQLTQLTRNCSSQLLRFNYNLSELLTEKVCEDSGNAITSFLPVRRRTNDIAELVHLSGRRHKSSDPCSGASVVMKIARELEADMAINIIA